MVLESLAASILDRYLGQYVSGFSKENLKFSVASGEAKLENLVLKKEALEELELPVTVKAGFLGKLTLNIPWQQLKSKPASIKIERLFLLAGPKQAHEFDQAAHEKRLHEQKLKKLEHAQLLKEQHLNLQQSQNNNNEGEKKGGDSFYSRMGTRLLDNLQIEINDVHIRYEDDVTDPKNPFVLGITLEKLQGQSTDSNWIPKWLEDVTVIHKLISLKNFAVYWNPNSTFLDFKNIEEMGKKLDELIFSEKRPQSDMHYILKPVSGSLRVIMNKSEVPDMNLPKIQMNFVFYEIGLALESNQYKNLTDMIDSFYRYHKGLKYQKFRPKVPPKQDLKAWWRYIGDSLIFDIQEKKKTWSWGYIAQRAKDRKLYINLYRKREVKLKMTPEELSDFAELEKKLSFEDILLFRSIADAVLKKDKEYLAEKQKAKTAKSGWISWVLGSGTTTTEETLPEFNLSKEDLIVLYDAIDYTGLANAVKINTVVPKEYVKSRVQFTLNMGIIELKGNDLTGKATDYARATFDRLGTTLNIREGSSTFEVALHSVEVLDLVNTNTKFQRVITPMDKGEQVFSMTFDVNPLSVPFQSTKKFDFLLKMKSRALEIVYNLKFFTNATPLALEEMELQAAARLKALQEQTRDQLMWAIANQKVVGLQIEVQAPTIVVPENCFDAATPLLVLYLGTLGVESNIKDAEDTSDEGDFYESFTLGLTNIKALITTNDREWRNPKAQEDEHMYLIEQFNLNFGLNVCKVESHTLTRVIVSGALPSLNIRMSTLKVKNFMNIIRAAIPGNNAPVAHAPSQATSDSPIVEVQEIATPKILSKSSVEEKEILLTSKLLEMSFSVPSLSISLSREESAFHEQPIVYLVVQGLHFFFVKRTYDTQASLSVHTLLIEDKMQPFGPDFKYFAASYDVQNNLALLSDTQLATLTYFSISRESPEYKSVDSTVDFQFNQLFVMLNRETLLTIMDFFSNDLAGDNSKPPSDDNEVLNTSNTSGDSTKDPSTQKQINSKGKSIITMKLNVNVDTISLTLNQEGVKLGIFSIENLTSSVKFHGDNTMKLEGILGNIRVMDLTPEGFECYPHILVIRGDKMVEFAYTTFTPDEREKQGYDSLFSKLSNNSSKYLDMTLNSLSYIYLSRFTSDVSTFFSEISSMQQIIASTRQRAQKAYVQTKSCKITHFSVTKMKVMKMDIVMKNPYIVIPENSHSRKVLIADLGQIEVQSSFVKNSEEQGMLENLQINMTAMSMWSQDDYKVQNYQIQTVQSSNKIVQNIDVKLLIQRPMLINHKVSDSKFTISVSKVKIILSEKQVSLLYGIYGGNLIEKPTHMKKARSLRQSLSQEKPKSQARFSVTLQPIDPNWVSWELYLLFSQISIDFLTSQKKLDNEVQMVRLDINKLILEMKTFYDTSLHLDATMESVIMTDTRPFTKNQFKQLLSPRRATDDSQLKLKYVRNSIGYQNMDVNFVQPCAVFVPEAYYEIRDYFKPLYAEMMSTLDKVSKANPTPRNNASTIPSLSKFTLNLNLVSADICLVENMDKIESRSIVLKTSLKMEYGSVTEVNKGTATNISMNIASMEVFKCVLIHEHDSSISIIQPFDMAFRYNTTPTKVDIQSKIEPMRMILSYQDFKLISNILATFTGSSNANSNPSTAIAETSGRRSMSDDIIEGTQKVPSEKKPAPQLGYTDEYKIEASHVRLTIIDDFEDNNTPVVDLFFNENVVNMSELTTKINVSTFMHANYFNSQIQRWEPLIEQYAFVVKISRTDIFQIVLISKEEIKMEVNITVPFVETILRVSNSWTADFYDTAVSTKNRQNKEIAKHPYYIRNETGTNVWYWLVEKGERDNIIALNDGVEQPLVPGIEKSLRAQRKADGDISSINTTISFQILGEFNPVSNIPIDKIGGYVLHMNPEDYSMKVIYEVSYRAGAKLLTLRSAISIYNDTDEPVDVRFTLPKSEPVHMGPIAPQTAFSVPVAYSSRSIVSFKPSRSEYGWSDPMECRRLTEKGTLTCKKQSDSIPYTYCIKVDYGGPKDKKQNRKNNAYVHQRTITLLPPVALANLLATDIQYQIFDGETNAPLTRGTIQRGKVASFHLMKKKQPMGMSVLIPGYKWSKVEVINGAEPPEVLYCQDDKNRILNVNVETRVSTQGIQRVLLYCKYWLVNNTGMRLIYGHNKGKMTAAGQTKYEDTKYEYFWNNLTGDPRDWHFQDLYDSQPLMFSSYNTDPFERTKCYVKFANSDWSKALNLESQGTIGVINLQSRIEEKNSLVSRTRFFQLSATVSPSPNPKFWRTKIVSFAPRFVLVNRTDKVIFYKQKDTNEVYSLLPQEEMPFHWQLFGNIKENEKEKEKQRFLQICLDGANYSWSNGFSVESLDNFAVKIPENQSGNSYFARVQVKLDKATTLVIFQPENKQYPPYRITNRMSSKVIIKQKGCEHHQIIPPNTSAPFTWDEPAGLHVLQVKVDNEVYDIKLDKIKKHRHPKNKFKAETYASGPTRVLLLHDEQSDQTPDELKEEVEELQFQLIVNMGGLGISFIDQEPQELMYLTAEKIDLDYSRSNLDVKIELMIKWLQIDNQLYLTPFPVVLSPVSDQKEFFHLSIVKYIKYTSIDYFKYLSILIQEMNIRFDEEFLIRMLSFAEGSRKVAQKQSTEDLIILPRMSYASQYEDSKMIYFELFHLNPSKANVSFMGIPGIEEKYQKSASMMLGVPTKLLANIDNAPLQLNLLMLKNPFVTRNDLIDRVTKHYISQVMAQVYNLLGALDFIGSPVSLLNNLGTGFYDFFHEPTKGIIQSPKHFGIGFAKGTSSLIKNSVYGIFNTVSKVTGSIGKGVATLSMDNDYLRKRQERSVRERPKHVGEGLLLGARDLSLGIFQGITGIIEEPIKGASAQGVEGFFKGIGRGVIGIAVKPTVGAIDFATQTGLGIRNTATLWESKNVKRRRPPRYIGKEGILENYNQEKAEGAEILKIISKGKHKDEQYLFSYKIPGQKKGVELFLLASSEHIMLRSGPKLKKIWKEKTKNILSTIAVQSDEIILRCRNADGETRVIPVMDRTKRDKIYESLMKLFTQSDAPKFINQNQKSVT